MKRATPGALDAIIMSVNRAYRWDALKEANLSAGVGVKAVSALGDDAFMGKGIGYFVRRGDKYIQIFWLRDDNEAVNEKASRYLVERAASRL